MSPNEMRDDKMPAIKMLTEGNQVYALPRAQGNNQATVRVILELEYKAAVRSSTLTNPRSGNNDECALTAREQPEKKSECNWCGNIGHWESECRKKAAGKPKFKKNTKHLHNRNSDDAQQGEVVFHTIDFQDQVLVDSSASSHMTGDATNLTDVRTYQRSVVVANSAKTHATKMGMMPVTTSEGATLVMHDVLLIENIIKHDATTIATSTLDTNNKMYILDQAATHERLDLVAHEPNKTRTPKNKVADLAPTGGTLTHRRRQPLRRHGTRNSHQLARTTNEVRLLREEQDHANKDTHPLVPSRGVLGVRLQMHYENDVIVRFVNSTDAATQQDNFAKGMACSKAQTGRKVKVFRSNSGSEYSSNAFNEALGEWGVVHETSTALPTTWQMNQNKKKKLDPKATKCVMMGYAEHQKAYKLYDLEQKKMVTSVQVQFRENEFLGERTPIDEYLVTVDDDDDDDEEGSLKGRRPLAQPLHPRRRHTRAPSTSAAATLPDKRSHFMVPPPPLPRGISDDLYRTRLIFNRSELGTPGRSTLTFVSSRDPTSS
ncbi:hypothetical protein B5M09_011523 [Aphanomyces astaci]|uniref:CCHC-type domain-containing protein n=1 Tax=Aphanomyces astaci TaxID=112090 RepID=A0A3R7Y485_APHAT|nr:hypothetical protein B5M09_011523 [Aphanomyces astaci]